MVCIYIVCLLVLNMPLEVACIMYHSHTAHVQCVLGMNISVCVSWHEDRLMAWLCMFAVVGSSLRCLC